MATLHDAFIENVKRRLAELGMNQASLAKEMNVSRPYISQLLSGKMVPSLTVVENVAKALHTNKLYLLTEVSPENSENNSGVGVANS